MRKRKKSSAGGYSLLEIVTSIALLGLVSASVCASLVLAVRWNAKSEQLMQAQLDVSSAVETLMEHGVDESSADQLEATLPITISYGDPNNNCYSVTVTSKLDDSVVVTTWIHAAEDSE